MSEDTESGRLRRAEFDEFRRIIYRASGIALGESKDALLSSRVARRMRELGLSSHAEYLDVIRDDDSGTEMRRLIDAISTNVTSFFREPGHFEILKTHLSSLPDDGTELTMWSAACSSGEEPYSMAMVAHAHAATTGRSVRILATDISGEVLDRARQGVYTAEKVSAVPAEYARCYLARSPDGGRRVDAACRRLVTFTRINLAKPPFPMGGPFEVIMCRNVMIYFDAPTRERLVHELERLLAPGGLMMLGHAESLAGMSSSLEAVAPAVYRKPRSST